MTTHSFGPSLARSAAQADAPWWEPIYREAFPTFQGMVNVRDDGSAQRDGIDRQITLANGRTVAVDEKVRYQDYNDFCLEYWSIRQKSGRRHTPGWVAKDLRCDFIAYAFVPSGRCFLLPFLLLRRAWREHHQTWVKTYREVRADNGSYWTISVAVPIDVVLDAIGGATLIHFQTVRDAA